MGLDMYLYARINISKFDDKESIKKAEEVRNIFPEMFKSNNLDSVEIRFESGYWRKANHIHKWFVKKCQEGKDECQDSYVSRNELKELLDLCKRVLNNKKLAKEELPSTSGCFFGGTDYDEYYFSDLEDTIKIIERCLKLPDCWDFVYHSSW